jgi:cysteine desulfurase
VPGIVGFGAACELSRSQLAEESHRIRLVRDLLERSLTDLIPGLKINGVGAERLPNTSSVVLPGVEADALLLNLPLLMMGTGSACTSGAIEPSHVLQAMGLSREDAYATIRVSLGRFTTKSEIQTACTLIHNVWHAFHSEKET